jgi:hypothetical protein
MECYLPCWIFCTFTSVLSETWVQCSIWLFSVVPSFSAFPAWCSVIFQMILGWFKLPPIITDITSLFTFHVHSVCIARSLHFRIFSASVLIAFLSREIATYDYRHYRHLCQSKAAYWLRMCGGVTSNLLSCVYSCTLLQPSSSIKMGKLITWKKQTSWLLGRMWSVGFYLFWEHTVRNPCKCTIFVTSYIMKLRDSLFVLWCQRSSLQERRSH